MSMCRRIWAHHELQSGQNGAALIVVVVVLAVLSALVAGLSYNVRLDLSISRNLRLHNQAFNWMEAGLDVTEEMIAHAVQTRGGDVNATLSPNLGSANHTVHNMGQSLFLSGGQVKLKRAGSTRAHSQVRFLGRQRSDGGSIIIAAGYEGIGKGAGSGSGMVLVYSIETNSTGPAGGKTKAAELYSYIGRGM